jgi:hypothetical protein
MYEFCDYKEIYNLHVTTRQHEIILTDIRINSVHSHKCRTNKIQFLTHVGTQCVLHVGNS